MQLTTRLLPALSNANLQTAKYSLRGASRSTGRVDQAIRRSLLTHPLAASSDDMAGTKNVLGGELEICCKDPVTGFSRDGFCRVSDGDFGVHAIAAVVTQEFLDYTAAQGNDLQTPHPPSFPGLKPGDRWCLCASRWKDAHNVGKAPKVVLEATDAKALEYIPLEVLKSYAFA